MISFYWKWIEGTETFLLLWAFKAGDKDLRKEEISSEYSDITWAEDHIEHGVMGELLSLANYINGLKLDVRRRLREFLIPRMYLDNIEMHTHDPRMYLPLDGDAVTLYKQVIIDMSNFLKTHPFDVIPMYVNLNSSTVKLIEG